MVMNSNLNDLNIIEAAERRQKGNSVPASAKKVVKKEVGAQKQAKPKEV